MRPLQQISPQVARGKLVESMWTDDNYLAEEKLDGERFKMHFTADGIRFDSRTISKKTDMFTEKTGNVPHLAAFVECYKELEGTVFDGEIKFGGDSMSTSTIMGCLPSEAVNRQEAADKWVDYYIFDVIFYKGRDMRDLPYHVRKEIVYCEFNNCLKQNNHFKLPVCTTKDKKKFCDDIMVFGGEGVILKHVKGLYTDKRAWIKVKATATFDMVVMGYDAPSPQSIKKGNDQATITRLAANSWIGAVVFGQYVNGTLEKFGACSGMSDEIRADFSENKAARIGTVITIEAQSRIAKTGYFRHPRFLRLRPDKNSKDCVYYENES